MDGLLDFVAELGSSAYGTLLVGAAASLAGIAAIRYRELFHRSVDEHKNTLDLIENLSEGIYRSSIDGRQLSANPALVRLNGYESEAEMLEAIRDIAIEWYVEPDRRDEFRAVLYREGHVRDFVSEVYRHKTRERIWVSESARIVRHKKTGKALYYEGSVREVTETVVRLKLEQQYQKLTSSIPGGLFQIAWTEEGTLSVEYLSEGFERLVDLSVEQHVSDRELFGRYVHPDDKPGYIEAFRASCTAMDPIDHEFRVVTSAGVEKWLRMTARPERSGNRVTWHGYVSDVSLRKRQAIEIEKLAYFDPLTNLPNRRLLLGRIAAAVTRCRADGVRSALFFIDLDNFKSLNDTQGHDVGDGYLAYVAGRLRGCVRATDTVARMGGDEFVIIMESLAADDDIAASHAIVAANQILDALRTPFVHGDLRHSSSASIGVVIVDGDTCKPDDILKRADIAMYQAKAAGRDTVALYDPTWMDGETERFALLGELRHAISDGALELHLQPQVDREGRVAGAEGLLRWNHPTIGSIPPERFIPLAEQSGMMNLLCRFVLATGVRKLAQWAKQPETARLRLAVNLSVQTFSGTDFVPWLEHMLVTHDVDPSLLTIEFTEHVMAKDQRLVARRMRALKQVGLRFSLDDFGTGYSSLSRLKSLPFDEVKIDGGFVGDIETSEGDRALVRTILAMANTLGLETVAEHVETANQEAFLHTFGCDLFQGFLYSAALDDEDFVALVRERNGDAPRRTADIVRLTA